MPWLQLHLTVDKSHVASIEQLFEEMGAVAVSLDDAGDEPMLEPGPGEAPLWQATRVSGLFEQLEDNDELRSAISQALATDVSRELRLEEIADRDWERAWLDRFRPMRFGERLWIRPGGAPIAQQDAVVVDLDPGLAFGTGTHPTTALCLRWLDAHPIHGCSVTDFGCGSGILAIAALRLGAAVAFALDHDPQAVLAARENAERNGVGDRLSVALSGDGRPPAADLVLANILANVLIHLAPHITDLLRPGGRLVLSGILQAQAQAVMQAYAGRIDFEPVETLQDWVLLHGRSCR